MSALAQNRESPELNDAFEKLVQEAARLQTVIDTVPSFLWTSLPDGSKEYLNKRWYEYTGLPLEQGKGWGWKVVVHPNDLDRLLGERLALLTGNINAPRQIVIASSNAGMNRVLEGVYWDQSSVSRGETSNSRGS